MGARKSYQPTYIRHWRKHRGYSLEKLAGMIGTSHATISRIERGLIPYNQDFLERVADALMCDPVDLLIRNPLDPEGIWSIWDNADPAQREKIVDIAKLLVPPDRKAS